MAKADLRDTGVRGSRSGKSTKSLRSKNSDGSTSLRISRQSRRREKMALAQLKLDQIKNTRKEKARTEAKTRTYGSRNGSRKGCFIFLDHVGIRRPKLSHNKSRRSHNQT